ncbi:MAG: glycosyltransferase family 4 protein [Rhizobiaceae bacterium]
MNQNKSLRIVHCFRSPVGGIFRHVRDLVAEQKKAGHQVGILCDSSTGGAFEEALFDQIKPDLDLGLVRISMRRSITPGDLVTLSSSFSKIKKLQPDVLHSHGAKGGTYARMIGSLLRVSGNRVARLYCPHGGTIHYDENSWKGKLFFSVERFLERMTDRLIFVSEYERDGYREKVGEPRCPSSLIYNGLTPAEYKKAGTDRSAADFLYIGMMRDLKGPDLFLQAIAQLNQGKGRKVTAHFVGDGPDKPKYEIMAREIGTTDFVTFHDAMPAREAFRKSRIVVIPSRAESMPYIVLEAIAAGKPVIATRVGGIPEIFADEPDLLVEPGNAEALAEAMRAAIDDPEKAETTAKRTKMLKERFSVSVMARYVNAAYLQCF